MSSSDTSNPNAEKGRVCCWGTPPPTPQPTESKIPGTMTKEFFCPDPLYMHAPIQVVIETSDIYMKTFHIIINT